MLQLFRQIACITHIT